MGNSKHTLCKSTTEFKPANENVKAGLHHRLQHKGRALLGLLMALCILSVPSLVMADITGNVFRDYNNNGVDDGDGEQGISSIVVTAYASDGSQAATATTNTAGDYTLTLGAGSYRLEFTPPADGSLDFLRSAVSPASSVQFAADGATVSAGFNSRESFSDPAPNLVTNIYTHGPAQGNTSPALSRFSFNSGCEDATLDGVCDPGTGGFDSPPLVPLATADEIGATMGMAVDRRSSAVFVASFMKRHVGFQRNGQTGVIYRIQDPDSATPGAPTVYVDFDALGIDTGTDPHPGDGAPLIEWEQDANSWDAVGKVGFGDLEISADESELYVVNLFDRGLYRIPVQTTPVTLADISLVSIPNPCVDVDDFRPFATKSYDSKVYVGVTCTGQSSVTATGPAQLQHLPVGSSGAGAALPGYGNRNLLSAHVFVYDPDDNQFENLSGAASVAPIFSAPLNYPRDRAIGSSLPHSNTTPGEWNPWTQDFIVYDRENTLPVASGGSCLADRSYPQPWLTDIEFDRGNLVLGIRDRFGDQAGYQQSPPPSLEINTLITPGCFSQTPPAPPVPSPLNNRFNGVTAGDILRACGDTQSGWSLENNASCGGVTTPGANTEGPGGGEYYYQDDYDDFPAGSFTGGFHNDVSSGGLAHIPGSVETVSTMYDPIDDSNAFYDGGIYWLDGDTGARTRGYRTYNTSDGVGDPNLDGTFAKSNGLGDLEPLSQLPSIEIGNLIWRDTNGDGVQDAGETGILGVTVQLWADTNDDGVVDAQVGTATTTATGNYVFGGETDANLNVGVSLNPTTAYEIRVEETQAVLASTSLTIPDNGASSGSASNADARDSDANRVNIGGVNTAVISYTTLDFGDNDDSLDIGFGPLASVTIVKNAVENDPQDFNFSASGGLTPANFVLDDDLGASAADAVNSDRHVFNDLSAGSYVITEAPAAGWDLTDIQCTGVTNSTITVGASGGFDAGDTEVTIGLASGENVSCIFTNTKTPLVPPTPTGSLSVTKLVDWNGRTPVPAMTFAYTIAGPAGFTTINDSLIDGATDTFTGLPFGDYTITETSPGTGWSITYSIDAGTPQAVGTLSLSAGTIPAITPAAITGTVFSDQNSNGTFNLNEGGLDGITITAYGADNVACGSTVSRDGAGNPSAGAQGTYEITPTCDGPWRLEFVDTLFGMQPSFIGADNGSTTLFVDDTNLNNNDVAFIDAVGFCQDNPKVVTPIYINGNQSGTQSVMSSVNYDRTGSATTVAQANQIGSTWGLAYQRDTQVLYASAVVKRHSGLGALGIGGVYAISDPAGTASPSNFVDVSSLGIDFGVIASNAGRGLPANVEGQSTDAAAYGQAGVIGIGDIDISDDNSTLWMVNLNNRSLVSLDVTGGAVPTSAQEFNVLGGAGAPSCTDGVLRPWALKLRGNTGYLGAVCTGENQADAGVAGAGLTLNIARNLVAYVFSFDTSDPLGTFTQELQIPLNYSKEGANNAGVNTDIWMPWRNVYNDAFYNGILGQRPTPVLTDLEFGDDGHLILGFADRSGFQIGGLNRQPDNPGAITSFAYPAGGGIGIQIGGDILKACDDGTGNFVLENNGSCGGVTGSGPALSGPGGASYYDARSGVDAHREASTGGLAVLSGSGETVYSAMDPGSTIFAGGLQWNNTVPNGARVGGFQFWNGTEFNVGFGGGGRSGKANGQGDVEILCDQAPIQLGNRVWDDLDQDGIQDPGEPGLNGVDVILTPTAGGTPVTVSTSGDGNYSFVVEPLTDYTLSIATPPVGYQLSPTDSQGNASNSAVSDVRDSDALDSAGAATIAYTTGMAGQNNHGLDFGFFEPLQVAAVINNTAPPPVSLGSTVFSDLNNNGVQDAGELGLANVRVQLFNDSGVEIEVGPDGILGNADDAPGGVITDVNGNYFFQDLLEGDYQVRLPASNFASGGALVNVPSSSTDIASTPNTDASGVDEDDNGLQAAGSGTAVVSPLINLTAGAETAPETNVGGSGGDAQDNATETNGDMRLDFGFYDPVSLGSTVFNDANNNGTQNAGETGIENVLVQLFTAAGAEIPVGPDGILGTADDALGGVLTDADGNYHFQNLVGGDYEVRVPASNFAVAGPLAAIGTSSTDIATTPNTDASGVDEDDNGLQTGGSGTPVVTPIISLTAGAETGVETNVGGSGGDALDNANENSGDMRLDLGFYAPVSLGSTVFEDTNNNGQQDAGESGLANVVVQLFDGTGAEVPIGPDGVLGTADDAPGGVLTDGSGNYFLQNLVGGDYDVRIPASNFAAGNALAAHQGSSTDIATTPNTDASGVDEDDNGLQAGGPGTLVVSPTINLTAGAETGLEANVGGSGGNALDDANEDSGDMRLDFGFFQTVSLGSTVFNDLDNSGTHSAGEPSLSNVVVQLFNNAGVEVEVGPDGMLGTADDAPGGVLSGVNGNYFFDGLPPGDYQVRLPASNFAAGGALADLPSSSTDIATTPNTDAAGVDEDDNGLQTGGSGTAVVSPLINLTAGAETAPETNVGGSGGDAQDNATETNGDMRLDFGFYDPVSLGSTVFNDANNNGTQNAGETGIENVLVQLFTAAGAEIPVGPDGILGTADDAAGGVLTDADGNYHFQNLVSGDYEVRVPASNFALSGALNAIGTSSTDIATTLNTDAAGVDEDDNGLQAAGSGTAVVTPTINLTAGAETNTETNVGSSGGDALDDANDDSGDMRLDLGFYAPVSLGSTVFADDNNNGLHDAGEVGLDDVLVQLFDSTGNEVLVGPDGVLGTADDSAGGVVTDANGNYFFQNLVTGDYEVRIPTSNFTTGNALAQYQGSSTDIASTPNTGAAGVDEDDNGLQAGGPGTLVVSPLINLTAGSETAAETNVGGSGGDAQDDANEDSGDMRLDFGFYQTVSLGSTVFNDVNNNGIHDSGEGGLANVTVQLFNDAGVEIPVGPDGMLGTPDDAVGGVVTDFDGNYYFDGLPPGNYQVQLPVGNFGAGNGLESTPSSSTDLTTTPNTDATGVDEDDNGLQTGGSGTPVVSPIINLAAGAETAPETDNGASGGNAQDDANEANGDMRLDFGFYDPVSLGSTVFNDANNNGTQDPTEDGIENVVVQLFTAGGVEVPVGPDGILGSADDALGGVSTDADGNYFFQNLVGGDYEVRVPASNFAAPGVLSGIGTSSTDIATTLSTDASGVDEDDNGLQPGGSGTPVSTPTITLTAGGETNVETNAGGSGGDALDNADEDSGDMRLDLGFYTPVSLGSTVFSDNNNNALQDVGEAGINGVNVLLFDGAGDEVLVGPDGILGTADDAAGGVLTDINGNYHFQNLVGGDYQVRIPASNFVVAGALAIQSGSSTDIATTLNTDDTGIDEDDNGLQAGGFGTEVVSPIINLTAGAETETETDNGGSGGNALDDANEDSGDMRLDFGFFSPVSVGSTVFIDSNNDGIRDGGASGLPNVTVQLFTAAGVEVNVGPDGILGTADDAAGGMLTNADGNYFFQELPPGDYQVRLPVSNFGSGGGLEDLPSSSKDIATTPNTDDTGLDEDDNGVQAGGSGTEVVSPIINLASGAETNPESTIGNAASGSAQDDINENNGDMRLDFGFYDPVSIGSTVFNDVNNNGLHDAGEAGIQNVLVQLFAGGVEVEVGPDGILGTADDAPGGVLTDVNGNYHFQNLTGNDYLVTIPSSNFGASGALQLLQTSSTTTDNTGMVDENDDGIQNAGVGTEVTSSLVSVFPNAATGIETNVGGSGGDALDNGDENSGDMSIDFGFFAPVSLGSTVFADANNNGLHDAGETGIENVVVQLFTSAGVEIPVGPDGILGTADDVIGGVLTDANGNYFFQNIAGGDYEVRLPASNFSGGALEFISASSSDIASTPNTDATGVDEDDNGLQTGGPGTQVVSPAITLTSGAETEAETDNGGSGGNAQDDAAEDSGDMRLDFGFFEPVSLGSTVFIDSDNDGLDFDANDVGIANVVVQLFDDTGVEILVGPDGILGTTDDAAGGILTDSDGNYFFQGLSAGNYQVRIPASEFAVSGSLANTPSSSTDIATTPNTDDATGIDEDDNGLQTGGSGTETVSPIINLSPGDENGSELNDGGSAGDAQDNLFEANGDMRLDFGFYDPVSLGSTVFGDANNNGLQDAAESGIENVVVRLFDDLGVEVPVGPDGVLGTADDAVGGVVTDADGNYHFQNLVSGDYEVRVPASNFLAGGALQGSPTSSSDLATTANTDNTGIDEDDNGLQPAGAGTVVVTPIITLTAGGETNPETNVGGSGGDALDNADEDSGDMRLDIGFYTPVSLGSTVFEDPNNNGLQEATEAGIANVTVQLFDSVGVEVEVGPDGILGTADDASGGVLTDGNGNYFFQNLVGGDYQVRIPASNFAAAGALAVNQGSSSDIATTPNTDDTGIDEDDNGLQVGGLGTEVVSPIINLTAGAETNAETNVGGSAGNSQDDASETSGDMRLDFGFYAPVSLGSTVFDDANNNAQHDAGEGGVQNVIVQLLNGVGVEVPIGPDGILGTADDATGGVITDGSGNYFFQGLPPGDYQVSVPASNFGNGNPLGALPSSSTDISSTPNTDATGVDEDDNGLQAGGSGTAVVTPIINLTDNGETGVETNNGGSGGSLLDDLDDDNGDMRLDLGFYAPVSLGSTVFADANNNGLHDAAEVGIENVEVQLFDEFGVEVPVGPDGILGTADDAAGGVITDVNGNYFFQNLVSGNYQITVPASNFLAAGALAATPTSSTDITTTLNTDSSGVDEDDNGLQTAGTGTDVTSPIINLTAGAETNPETNAGGSGGDAQDNALEDSGDMRLDMGFYAPVSVGSTVFNDINNNGLHDAGETGIANVMVQLFDGAGVEVPVGPDGILGNADDAIGGVLSDGSGNYHFQNLVSGDYQVRIPVDNFTAANALNAFLSSSGDIATTNSTDAAGIDEDDNGLQPGGVGNAVASPTISLTVGTETNAETDVGGSGGAAQDDAGEANGDMRLDFGFFQPISLGSVVFEDDNQNGVDDATDSDGTQQVGEPGINGATVSLFRLDASGLIPVIVNADGVYVAGQIGTNNSVVTSNSLNGPVGAVAVPDGSYNFSGLPQDDYVIRVAPGSAYAPSPVQNSVIDTTNLDSNLDLSRVTTFGEWESGLISLAANFAPTGETDPSGNAEIDPSNLNQLDDDSGNLSVDFGFIQSVAVGNTVWLDDGAAGGIADDGIINGGEAGINGVTVELYNAGDTLGVDTPVATQITDARGHYLFSFLMPGDYVVYIPASNFVAGAPLAGLTSSTPEGGDNQLDDNADENGLNTLVAGGVSSSDIELTIGGEPVGEAGAADNLPNSQADSNTDSTVDFGFVPMQLGSIGNYVWLDEDSDGEQDAGESGVPNITIELKDAVGTVIATEVTDANGGYLFTDLPAGEYFVDVQDASLPAGLTQTTLFTNIVDGGDTDAVNDDGDFGNKDHSADGYPVTLDEGEDNLTADFGYNWNTTDEVTNNTGLAALGDRIWIDSDGDGVQDAGEVPVSGVQVSLFTDPDGDGVFDTPYAPSPTQTTDANGNYLFDDLPVGAYVVTVTDSSAATHDVLNSGDFTQTGDPDHFASDSSTADAGQAQDNTSTSPIVLSAGDVFLNADFGYQATPAAALGSIGDTLWIDTDGDGSGPGIDSVDGVNNPTLGQGNNNQADDGEPVLPGVSVSLIVDTNANGLIDTGEAVIATDTTDENGQYLFNDLPLGVSYIVEITDTDNVLDGLSPTYDSDGALGTPNTSSVAALAGDDREQDFGYISDDPTNPNDGPIGSIGDTVWGDLDGSGGDQNSQGNEPGLANVTVNLFVDEDGVAGPDDVNQDGTVDANDAVATTTTDMDGMYLFTGLPLTTYIVGIDDTTLPDGYLLASSYLPAGGGTENEANTLNDLGDPVTLSASEPANRDQDFSYPAATGALGSGVIGDTVWGDTDGDGNGPVGAGDGSDASEPPLAGVVVRLFDDSGTLVDTQVTDMSGNYLFIGLDPTATYSVLVDTATLPAGYGVLPSGDPEGDGNSSSRVDLNDGNSGTEDGVNDPDGENGQNLGQDFGYPPVTVPPADVVGSIGDTVWFDVDNSGGDQSTQGAEPGLAGVTVTLTPPAGVDIGAGPGNPVTTVTDGNGEYLFSNLPLDDGGATTEYTVSIDNSTLPSYVTESPSFDPEGDGDNSAVVGLSNATPDNREQDFSYPPATESATIGDSIFLDTGDTPGAQDDEDTPVAGVDVNLLLDTSGDGVPDTPVGMQTTDANGQYLFTGLDPNAVYGVEVATSNFNPGGPLEGTSNSVDPDGGNDNESIVDLSAGDGNADEDGPNNINLGQDFGFTADTPVDVGNLLWLDLDADGLYEPNGIDGIAGTADDETPIAGVTVDIYRDLDGNGEVDSGEPLVGQTVTSGTIDDAEFGSNGNYVFSDLPADNYVIKVTDEDGVLTGYWHSEGADQTADDSSKTETYAVDATGGDNLTGDFGYYVEPGAVGDVVWEDLNGNGLYDPATEPGIDNVTVTLTIEYPDGAIVELVDITEFGGVYNFDNLNLDEDLDGVATISYGSGGDEPSHVVALDPSTTPDYLLPIYTFDLNPQNTDSATVGGSATDQDDLDQGGDDGTNGEQAFPPMGSVDSTNDFGFAEAGSIGNYVWLDFDMDGVQDANEDGIAGVTVNLFEDTDGNGVIDGAELTTPVATVVTGPNGEYLFPNLTPGTVYITQVDISTVPAGFVQTYDEGPTAGSLGTLDNTSEPIVLTPGEEHLTADFGYTPPAGSLGDTIWVDSNDNGQQDPGEPGLANVVISIQPEPDVDLGAGPGVAITTTTDDNGKYLFTNLPINKTYIVTVASGIPPEYMLSASGLGDPDVRDGNSQPSDADGVTYVLLTTDDPVNLDADFGYVPDDSVNNSVSGTVWQDTDEDGNGAPGAGDGSDVNEGPIPSVTVSLIQDNGDGIYNPIDDPVIATTTTGPDGTYEFTGLPDGDYFVLVTDQNNVLSGLEQTVDSDDPAAPGAFNPATPNISFVDDLGVGVDTPATNDEQDFGYVEPSNTGGDGSIGDTVFFDEDNSGTPDPGEGIEGVVVQLFGPGPDGVIGTADDVLIASETTDENGNYLFTGLDTRDTGPDAGTDYQVVVVTSSLPNGGDGWVNSVDPDTPMNGDSISVVTLTPAEPSNVDQDFGYVSQDNNAIRGTIWPDTNGDGMQVEGGGFSGVTVELRDENGNVIQTTTTDTNGDFSFENLPDGIYTVVVTDEDNILNGFEHTDSPNGTSDTSNETSKDDTGYTVDLDSTGIIDDPVTDETSDFGYEPVVTNPISLGLFSAQTQGDHVVFDWQTQTEVANLGFYVYARVDGEWLKLNDQLILGQGDSVHVQSYDFSAPINVLANATVFALSDIDLEGNETLHGPFRLGQQYGMVSERRKIDWNAERAEREAKEAKRKQLKQQQQLRRTQQLMQRTLRQSSVPQRLQANSMEDAA